VRGREYRQAQCERGGGPEGLRVDGHPAPSASRFGLIRLFPPNRRIMR
jgi:hypothetical protein